MIRWSYYRDPLLVFLSPVVRPLYFWSLDFRTVPPDNWMASLRCRTLQGICSPTDRWAWWRNGVLVTLLWRNWWLLSREVYRWEVKSAPSDQKWQSNWKMDDIDLTIALNSRFPRTSHQRYHHRWPRTRISPSKNESRDWKLPGSSLVFYSGNLAFECKNYEDYEKDNDREGLNQYD